MVMNLPTMNVFKLLGPKLEKAVSMQDVNKFRLTICNTLYGASLRLVKSTWNNC